MNAARSALVLLALSTIDCGNAPPASHVAGLLAGLRVDPGATERDRTPRIPTVVLRFDRALAPPAADSLAMFHGEVDASLRAGVAHGTWGPGDLARRIPTRIAWDATRPEEISVIAREALRPDAPFVVAVTTRVRTREGGPVESAIGHPGGWLEPLRVDSPPGTETLATLITPGPTDAPRMLTRAVVAFNRAVHPPPDALGPVATLRDAAGGAVNAVAVLDCETAGQGFACLTLAAGDVLAADADYVVEIGDLEDDAGRIPRGVELRWHTGSSVWGPAARADAPVPCAPDEIARAPFCLLALAGGVEVRGATDANASIEVLAAGQWRTSPVGTVHDVGLQGFAMGESLALEVDVRATDGSVLAHQALGEFTVPTLPALRITEVLARPRGASTQEFVELINDGDASASTMGLSLASATGASPLPDDGVVPAGARAIVVGHGYDPRGDSEGDPAPAPGTIVLRLRSALTARGLSDRGARLTLRGPNGEVLSQAPTDDPALAPEAGVSVVRADLRIREDDPAAWSYDDASGSTPGLPDRVR